ncbi:hypothetical protein KKF82_05405, partial [Patescibacteria group bacterium]|nr:hypothetical protein [Patescibacteria group bacterium]
MEAVTNRGDFPVKVNEFVHILSTENGKIKTVVGPTKIQISGSEDIVKFNESTKTFDNVVARAAQNKIVTPKGWYTILTNPAHPDKGQPESGQLNEIQSDQLIVGTKIIINGPNDMALWPGQYCKTIKGHTLKSNEYLVCRIYDEKAAVKNWTSAIVKGSETGKEETDSPLLKVPALCTGQRIIIKGTDVSFYIPPTGVEVIKGSNGYYIQEAVTLQKMEYCVKIKEDGTEIFKLGPAVVFPEADEQFKTEENAELGTNIKKFKALDLNELSGVYVKVTANYREGEGDAVKEYKEGQELFITGETTPIYVPRAEHSIISYGDKPIVYAVAIPKGEGRYVMNRLTGEIKTVEGPRMYLADPRKEVFIRRVLTDRQCDLWFPNNQEAKNYNRSLREELDIKETSGDLYKSVGCDLNTTNAINATTAAVTYRNVMSALPTKVDLSRSNKFSKPRTLEINSKYEGAVRMDVWPGYALFLKDAKDKTRVIVGPKTVLLDYDETPISIEVSTGKPKNTDRLHKDIYLQVSANQVTDIIGVETSDYVELDLKLSYRVNFVGENPSKWWNVKNYVKLLTDHMRSMLKNKAKSYDIDDFYNKTIPIVRDSILGTAEEGARKGFKFAENEM